MGIAVEVGLIFVLLLGLGVWGIATGVRVSRTHRAAGVSPQQLAALAQPYRGVLGEAADIQKDVNQRVREAPAPLRKDLVDLSQRISRLIERAYPRARHGTTLAGYLLELESDDPQFQQTSEAATRVETELEHFLDTLKALRGKIYQLLTNATSLETDSRLGDDLHDVLIEVEALEEAFREG